MRRRLILHEQDLLAKGFLPHTLWTSILFTCICFWTDLLCLLVQLLVIRLQLQALRVYKYTKIQGPWFQRNYVIARDQKLFTWHVISIIVCSSQDTFAYNESFHFLSLIFGWRPHVYYLWISGETLIKRSIYLSISEKPSNNP